MKIFKKSISLLLSIVMIVSVFTIIPFESNATETEDKTATEGQRSDKYVSGIEFNTETTQINNNGLQKSTETTTEIAIEKSEPINSVKSDKKNKLKTASNSLGDYEYGVSNSEVIITKYKGNASTVTIPDKIEGYNVVKIGSNAFSKCTQITKLTLPESLKEIEWAGLADLSIEEITLPNSVTKLGKFVFSGCTKLKKINLSKNLKEMGGGTFYNTAITSIEIPASLTTCEDGPFEGCETLEDVTFESGTERIASDLFQNSLIEKIVIPNTVKSIGEHAFLDCSKLKTVIIGDSVETIGMGAFERCTQITKL
ncbi:MAG: leucine-rich repeat protein, partial [Ruminococcus sp.]|nr:leucine-rich repeat protein [Ruminococcus sp.]